MKKYAVILLLLIQSASCGHRQRTVALDHADAGTEPPYESKCRAVIVRPFDNFPDDLTQLVFESIKQINPKARIGEPLGLPKTAYNEKLDCYRADLLIDYLKKENKEKDTITLALTQSDLCRVDESGNIRRTMGLAAFPGDACVVSTFQLTGKAIEQQLIQLSMHELGHTEGLEHCGKHRYCYMYGKLLKNRLWIKRDFCPACKLKLVMKGWEI